jgi:hypothetical protein
MRAIATTTCSRSGGAQAAQERAHLLGTPGSSRPKAARPFPLTPQQPRSPIRARAFRPRGPAAGKTRASGSGSPCPVLHRRQGTGGDVVAVGDLVEDPASVTRTGSPGGAPEDADVARVGPVEARTASTRPARSGLRHGRRLSDLIAFVNYHPGGATSNPCYCPRAIHESGDLLRARPAHRRRRGDPRPSLGPTRCGCGWPLRVCHSDLSAVNGTIPAKLPSCWATRVRWSKKWRRRHPPCSQRQGRAARVTQCGELFLPGGPAAARRRRHADQRQQPACRTDPPGSAGTGKT